MNHENLGNQQVKMMQHASNPSGSSSTALTATPLSFGAAHGHHQQGHLQQGYETVARAQPDFQTAATIPLEIIVSSIETILSVSKDLLRRQQMIEVTMQIDLLKSLIRQSQEALHQTLSTAAHLQDKSHEQSFVRGFGSSPAETRLETSCFKALSLDQKQQDQDQAENPSRVQPLNHVSCCLDHRHSTPGQVQATPLAAPFPRAGLPQTNSSQSILEAAGGLQHMIKSYEQRRQEIEQSLLLNGALERLMLGLRSKQPPCRVEKQGEIISTPPSIVPPSQEIVKGVEAVGYPDAETIGRTYSSDFRRCGSQVMDTGVCAGVSSATQNQNIIQQAPPGLPTQTLAANSAQQKQVPNVRLRSHTKARQNSQKGKKKMRLSLQQRMTLQRAFDENQIWSRSRMDSLAAEVGVSSAKVYKWHWDKSRSLF